MGTSLNVLKSEAVFNDPAISPHAFVASQLAVAVAKNPAATILPIWQGLAEGHLKFADVLSHFHDHPGLTYLTIDTTGACDLTCPGMCYYHPKIDLRRPSVSLESLCVTIRDAHALLGLKNLVFAGKEPLLNAQRLFELCRFANELPKRDFAIGIVTNGRGLERHHAEMDELVLANGLNFIDISLDSGIPEQHDTIRGLAGTFARAFAELERCSLTWPEVRVGSSSVLRADNGQGILELFRKSARFNKHFFVTPIQPPPFTSTSPLTWPVIRRFLNDMKLLLSTELRHAGLDVMVSMLGIYALDAHRDGWFEWSSLREDSQGQCYVPFDIGGNQLNLHVQILPETGWRLGRVTYAGDYLPNTHFVQDPHPERFAVGNIELDSVSTLYARAMSQTSLWERMYLSRDEHSCRSRSCWATCFGGLAAAEHILTVDGALSRQPALCVKTDADFQIRQPET